MFETLMVIGFVLLSLYVAILHARLSSVVEVMNVNTNSIKTIADTLLRIVK